MKSPTEQRWNPRKQIKTEVILHFSRLGVVRAQTRDISYGGVRLEVKPLVLDPNTRVRATFIMRQAAEVAHQSIDALVIYMNGHGCGLMFDRFDRGTFRFLHRLMHAGPRAAAV